MGLLTAEEFARTASEHQELVDGVPVPMMTPTHAGHGRVASRFVQALLDHADRTGAGEVFTAEAGFVTRRNPDRVRAPDVAFVVSARLEGIPEDGFFDGPPDIVVEVLSTSDRPVEIAEKVAEYLTAGARLVWVADRKESRLVVHRAGRGPRVLGLEDVLDGEDVLPGFRAPVSRLLGR